MSSAILYVAIVAIWAGVLIPRWLRRDPAVGVTSSPSSAEVPADDGASAAADEGPAAPSRHRDQRREAPAERRPAAREGRDMRGDEVHRRVLAARRRLLGMLIVLTIGSGVLAYTRMAAWWVIVPPSAMLFGYLLLLRAAGKVDTERRQATRDPARPARPRRSRAAAAPAPAAAAEVIAISGPPEHDDEELYDQYADAKLRAVGD